jgi:inositol 1,4,5-triphosphate receptor type 1/inositol 1,4,5-triphosphate receptor type 3
LWNYLYYLYCLRLKSPTDFTGLEYEIDKKVNEEDVEWFPALGEGDTEGEA